MSMADKKREPIAVWWEISKYMATILPVDVVDFTEATVVCLEGTYRPRERRHRREDIFPSFAEAKAEAISRATQRAEYAQKTLDLAKDSIRKWESLTEEAALKRSAK